MNGVTVNYFTAETRRAGIVVFHANGHSQDIGFVIDTGDWEQEEADRLNQQILDPVRNYLEQNFVPCPAYDVQFDFVVSSESDKIILKNEDGNPHVALFSPLPDEIINTALMWNRYWGWTDLRRFWWFRSELYRNDIVPIDSLKEWRLIINRADCAQLACIGKNTRIDVGACFERPSWAKVFVKAKVRLDGDRWHIINSAHALVIPEDSNPDNASDLVRDGNYRENITRVIAQIAESISEADDKMRRAEDVCQVLSSLSAETNGAYVLVPPQTVLEQIKQISLIGKR